ncbi:MAG: hypothetical protein HXS48_05520 [Theionarchaea archaeon]|nr:hypothetical protein [Theionarchaea archaeon]
MDLTLWMHLSQEVGGEYVIIDHRCTSYRANHLGLLERWNSKVHTSKDLTVYQGVTRRYYRGLLGLSGSCQCSVDGTSELTNYLSVNTQTVKIDQLMLHV